MIDKGFFFKFRFGKRIKRVKKRELNVGRGFYKEGRGIERKVWSLGKIKISLGFYLEVGMGGLYGDKEVLDFIRLELIMRFLRCIFK